MYTRKLGKAVREALADTPVVLLTGARQAGKTTLARSLLPEARYLTFDDVTVAAAAAAEPQAFVEAQSGPTILDEVQRVPGIFRAIKLSVDRDRRPGRFLLTGSANALLVSRAADELVGRMQDVVLWPLSQGEIADGPERFVDHLFGDAAVELGDAISREQLIRAVVRGGYPEVVSRPPARSSAWFDAYVTTLLQREIRDLADVSGLHELPRLLMILAARCGSLLNYAEISRAAGIAQTTLKRYMALLEATFLTVRIPAWSANLGKRLTRSPKLMLADTGLAAHLRGSGAAARRPSLDGALLENFVAVELLKQLGWSATRARLYHFRTAAGQEVDLVLESADGRIVGVEVKASTVVQNDDTKGLRALRDLTANKFHHGIVLYGGSESLLFANDISARPISALWAT